MLLLFDTNYSVTQPGLAWLGLGWAVTISELQTKYKFLLLNTTNLENYETCKLLLPSRYEVGPGKTEEGEGEGGGGEGRGGGYPC